MKALNFQNIIAAMWCEIRSVRRLARTWVMIAIAFVMVVVFLIQQLVFHTLTSGATAIQGLTFSPELLTTNIGSSIQSVFSIGMVFLVFDIRGRDVRDRIAEVLDARAITNFELVCGRMLGVVFIVWVTYFAAVILCSGVAVALEAFTTHFGGTPDFLSLLSTLLVGGVPGFIFYCSLFAFITALVRNRLLAVLGCFVAIGLLWWGAFQVPLIWANTLATTMYFDGWPSALTNNLPSGRILGQRLGVLALSAALLAFAALVYARRDSVRPTRLALAGCTALATALVAIGGMTYLNLSDMARIDHFSREHQSLRLSPRVDLHSISGTVTIKPGRDLALELVYQYELPTNSADKELLFSFNPAMEVASLLVNGKPTNYTHRDGLLLIERDPSWQPGMLQSLKITANGIPDPLFSYLDAPLNVYRKTSFDSTLTLLGIDASYFESGIVTLMPATRWYPVPGPNLDQRQDPQIPVDYFNINLDVSVPSDWIAAGPGRTEESDEGDVRHFKFSPEAPVPEIGLVAAPYYRAQFEVEGITFELLLHKKHRRNATYFSGTVQKLEDDLSDLMNRNRFRGMGYPYRTFSLVEVPLGLRTYGGGWRMDSVQGMPGLAMMRETSFPLSRFSWVFRQIDENQSESEEATAEAKLHHLRTYFENDFVGGNIFSAFARSQFLNLTSARGSGAIPLNFFIETLVLKTALDTDSFFNAYLFESQQVFQQLVGYSFASSFELENRSAEQVSEVESFVPSLRTAYTHRPPIWNRALNTALVDLEYVENPAGAFDVLLLRVSSNASAYFDYYGARRITKLLSELRNRYLGTTFTVDQFFTLAEELDVGLEPILGSWLQDAGLPGYRVSDGTSRRLGDLADRSTFFETSFNLRNSEPFPGVVKMVSVVGEKKGSQTRFPIGGPLLIPGHTSFQINTYSEDPIREVQIDPYLSRNRNSITIAVPKPDDFEVSDAQPRPRVEENDWMPETPGVIVVDDLDDGFALSLDNPIEPRSGGVRAWIQETFTPKVVLDSKGVPEYDVGIATARGNIQLNVNVDAWARRESPLSFGRYRKTYISSTAKGDGGKGTFSTNLPKNGRWRLEYHIPFQAKPTRRSQSKFNFRRLGTYVLVIAHGGSTENLDFLASESRFGWNFVEIYDLEAGEISVEVKTKSSGRVALDAIRWTLIEDRAP